jgi:hypothetical protein
MIYYLQIIIILPIVIFLTNFVKFFKRLDRTAQIYQNAKANFWESQKVLEYLVQENKERNKK